MSFSFIIEIGEDAVGLVHRESETDLFRFFSSDRRFSALDGSEYSKPAKAEAAVREWLRQRRKPEGDQRQSLTKIVRFKEQFPGGMVPV